MLTSSETTVALPAGVDLHARPAATFVRAAMRYASRVEVVVGDRAADAKSLLGVLALGVKGGTELRLRADGDDAAIALDELAAVVTALE